MTKFIFTQNYEKELARIENHIFSTNDSLKSVESFLDKHDKALSFIAENSNTPTNHAITGEQTWCFEDGRYRLFFKCVQVKTDITVYLTHLIDNKEANLDVYPNNKIPTFYED